MGGQAQADGFARRVAQAAWHLFAGFQNKGKGPGRGRLEEPKLAVVHARIVGQLAQVAAQKRQVVFVVHTAQLAQAVGSGFVVQVADQRVARIGGHCQHAAFFE